MIIYHHTLLAFIASFNAFLAAFFATLLIGMGLNQALFAHWKIIRPIKRLLYLAEERRNGDSEGSTNLERRRAYPAKLEQAKREERG